VINTRQLVDDDDFFITPEESKRKVPIGTFWQSQKRKHKRKDIRKVVKVNNHKFLQSTLLETIPVEGKRRKLGFDSPFLIPMEGSTSGIEPLVL
jgi:hypothetical protein